MEPITGAQPANALDELMATCSDEVASACTRLAQPYGYRFLTGPRATLAHSTEVALITLNPGGGADSANQSGPSYENGSSYVTERWAGDLPGDSPLQRQVQALFREVMAQSGEYGPVDDFLANHVLTAHFIPFRSPSFATLTNARESIAFGRRLWTRILRDWRPRLILTIDQKAFSNVADIISELGGRPVGHRQFATGWGTYTCEAVRLSGFRSDGVTTLARLPHLSRFSLFTEPGYSTKRRAALQPFFEWITRR